MRLNTPRFASLPNIMKAKKKPVTVEEAGEIKNQLEKLDVLDPPAREGGKIVDSVDELISHLKDKKLL